MGNSVNISKNIDKISSNMDSKGQSSKYYQNFRKIIKEIYESETEKEKNNGKKLIINLDFFDVSKRGYYYKFENEDNVYNLNNIRKDKKDWVSFNDVVNILERKKIFLYDNKKVDPSLVEILYNVKGPEAVHSYLVELNKGKKANKELLPFTLNYNLTSVWKNKGLSFKEKINYTRMIKQNKNISNVDNRLKIGKRIATAFAAIGLLFSTAPKLNSGNIENEKGNLNKNSMVDTIDRTTTDNSKTEYNEITTTKSNGSYSLTQEEKERIIDETEKIIEKHNLERNESKQNKSNDLNLGAVLELPEGLQFSEGVSGGKTGRIGESASPVDGIYVIDHFAEVSENGVSSISGLDGKIESKMPNSDEFVHISFVKGAQNKEEAKKIISEQRNNAKDKSVDNNKIQPRGWVSAKTIKQLYNMQQNNIEQEMEK